MRKHIGLIVAFSIAAGIAGCASYPEITTQTVIVSGVGPVEVERLRVQVVSVDRPNRAVMVEQRGYRWLVEVPPVFGNLERLRAGDMVDISRVEGAVVDVRRNKRNARPGIAYAEAATRSTFQNLPDKYVARAVTLTAKFEQFDAATSLVSYVGPFGPRTLKVVDPAVKAALQRLRRGDMVDLTFAEAFHIVVS